jgi:hypothetical protein
MLSGAFSSQRRNSITGGVQVVDQIFETGPQLLESWHGVLDFHTVHGSAYIFAKLCAELFVAHAGPLFVDD